MTKTIISAAGTSAARILRLRAEGKTLLEWINAIDGTENKLEKAADSLYARFKDIPPEGDNLKSQLSAEIHSLVRIGLDPTDRVLLLASSTNEGLCCALAVQKYLKQYWPGIDSQVETVPGLQVDEPEIFRTKGVVEFVKRINKEIENYGSSNIILNPTAGFKALVPYTVLLGMLKGIECKYIFEQSTALLELPPLPVEFRQSQFEAYRSLFEKIERESFISEDQWKQQVPYEDRKWFSSLIETSGGSVTLSAVGFLFLDEIRRPSALTPFLSQQAIEDCFHQLAPLENCDPFRFLSRVSRDQQLLNKSEHINMGEGLRWLKPGRTTDRYLVSVEGWRLLVWRAIREDQVGANYPTQVTLNPLKDRKNYAPFMRMEFIN